MSTADYRAQIPPDISLADELSCDDVIEMANLTSQQTGVPGTIFISTAMGPHGPHVKYFVRPGRTQPSFSVSVADPPMVVANSLPARVLRQRSLQVIEQGCIAEFLEQRRYLDAARRERLRPAAAADMRVSVR